MLRNTLLYLRFPLVTYVTVRSRQEIRVRRVLLAFDKRQGLHREYSHALSCLYLHILT